LFGTFYGVVFTIYTIYVLTAAEAYGLFSREVRFNFNYIKKKKKKSFIVCLDIKKNFLVCVARYNKKEGEFFLFGWLYIKIRKYKGNTREEKYKKKKNTSLLFNFGDSI
jgi:hypothetical protein